MFYARFSVYYSFLQTQFNPLSSPPTRELYCITKTADYNPKVKKKRKTTKTTENSRFTAYNVIVICTVYVYPVQCTRID